MRKISEEAADALIFGYKYKKSNTEVVVIGNSTYLKLHGNTIARKIGGELTITMAGWFTNLTKERLNALPVGVRINSSNGQYYLNGTPWDGEWIKI